MYVPFLKTHLLNKVLPELMKTRGYKNKHEIPIIEKIVINSGVSAQFDKSMVEEIAHDLSILAAQKTVITQARKSIANFKVREGHPVGVKVTLRGNIMFEFLQRLISVALPGIRDFRGLSRKFDGHGNYNLGIADHTIFPEINMDSGRHTIGMDITIVTTAQTDEEGYALLSLLGMPFRKK